MVKKNEEQQKSEVPDVKIWGYPEELIRDVLFLHSKLRVLPEGFDIERVNIMDNNLRNAIPVTLNEPEKEEEK